MSSGEGEGWGKGEGEWGGVAREGEERGQREISVAASM